ncbi:MAG: SMI1/KNR4 family protein [Pseudomonadales bacterium]
MGPDFSARFPTFANLIKKSQPEEILPPLSSSHLAKLETSLGILLPNSYKSFLEISGGLWLLGGAVQLSSNHPFPHDFPAYKDLSPQHKTVVRQRGGIWPPPSQGMLCFAEYFLEADGDQVLFKTDEDPLDGEYPVYYYAHENSPARVSQVADSFFDWIENVCIQSFSDG